MINNKLVKRIDPGELNFCECGKRKFKKQKKCEDCFNECYDKFIRKNTKGYKVVENGEVVYEGEGSIINCINAAFDLALAFGWKNIVFESCYLGITTSRLVNVRSGPVNKLRRNYINHLEKLKREGVFVNRFINNEVWATVELNYTDKNYKKSTVITNMETLAVSEKLYMSDITSIWMLFHGMGKIMPKTKVAKPTWIRIRNIEFVTKNGLKDRSYFFNDSWIK